MPQLTPAAPSVFAKIRKSFFSGLVLLAPIGITFFVFNWLVVKVGGSVKDQLLFFVPDHLIAKESLQFLWNTVATLVVMLLITVLGFFSRYVIAKYLFTIGERILDNVPFFNTVYKSVKQIIDTFGSQKRAIFQQVVLIEFPRPGTFALGFLTSESEGEVQTKTNQQVCNVFVPTTPNPTSGFLIMVPQDQMRRLEMSVGEGMKLIISGGAVVPPYPPIAKPIAPPAGQIR